MKSIVGPMIHNLEWLIFGFIGVVLAVLRADAQAIGPKVIITTLLSGLVCAYLVPELLKGYFGIEIRAVLYLGAFCGGLLGMRIVAALHKLDVEKLVKKRLGDE